MTPSNVTINLSFNEIALMIGAVFAVVSGIVSALWVWGTRKEDYIREMLGKSVDDLNRNTSAMEKLSEAVRGNTDILDLYREILGQKPSRRS